MKSLNQSTTTRRSFLALLLGTPTLFALWKTNEYAADPDGEKACLQLDPALAQPVVEPAVVEAEAADFALPWAQKGGAINDASCVNETAVYGIVQVRSEEDIRNALRFAAQENLQVAMAGVRHSMGGQAFYRGALVLDMRQFNQISLDAENKLLTAQSGASWHQIQELLHPRFAVKAMQSTDIFTVGGSISVNAHGMDHNAGALGRTVRAMRIMLADGAVQTVSREENPELFALVLGGYGLFGIILEAVLEVTDNVIYQSSRRVLDYAEFPALFDHELINNPRLGLMYGHLSTAPQSLLREMLLYTYEVADADAIAADAVIPALGEVSNTKLRRLVLNLSKQGALAMRLKWFAEKHVEPRLESCSISRNQAMKEGEACLVSRNEPMHDSVKYLQNNLKNETDILHEYFIPRDQFVTFIDGLRQIVLTEEVNLLNASVRVVHKEDNFLNYAPADMFSIVLYINQPTTAAGHDHMHTVTSHLVDLAISLNGTFFLPYQLYFTPGQLRAAYPQIDEFFMAKLRYDPQERFTNTFYEKYAA
ncbi:MAG: FAD-binding oxidoreductase [Caldilineaceae bacterium]|nr:FAD-binding oxidoreductase [Caldilineaceae bacterium]